MIVADSVVPENAEPITVVSDRFAFARAFRGLEILPKAGTIIARDGEEVIATPYDDCVIVMPAFQVARGQTAVRLGRFRDLTKL